MRFSYKFQKPECPNSVCSGTAVVNFRIVSGKADFSSPTDGFLQNNGLPLLPAADIIH